MSFSYFQFFIGHIYGFIGQEICFVLCTNKIYDNILVDLFLNSGFFCFQTKFSVKKIKTLFLKQIIGQFAILVSYIGYIGPNVVPVTLYRNSKPVPISVLHI